MKKFVLLFLLAVCSSYAADLLPAQLSVNKGASLKYSVKSFTFGFLEVNTNSGAIKRDTVNSCEMFDVDYMFLKSKQNSVDALVSLRNFQFLDTDSKNAFKVIGKTPVKDLNGIGGSIKFNLNGKNHQVKSLDKMNSFYSLMLPSLFDLCKKAVVPLPTIESGKSATWFADQEIKYFNELYRFNLKYIVEYLLVDIVESKGKKLAKVNFKSVSVESDVKSVILSDNTLFSGIAFIDIKNAQLVRLDISKNAEFKFESGQYEETQSISFRLR